MHKISSLYSRFGLGTQVHERMDFRDEAPIFGEGTVTI